MFKAHISQRVQKGVSFIEKGVQRALSPSGKWKSNEYTGHMVRGPVLQSCGSLLSWKIEHWLICLFVRYTFCIGTLKMCCLYKTHGKDNTGQGWVREWGKTYKCLLKETDSILISDKVHFRTKKVLGIKILHDDKSINSLRRQKLRAFIYKTTKPQNIEGKTQECRKKKQPRVSDGD